MKKFIFISAVLFSTLLTSCLSDPQGASKSSRYSFLNRRQAVIVCDNQTGEMFRVILKPDGSKTWENLGSPNNAR